MKASTPSSGIRRADRLISIDESLISGLMPERSDTGHKGTFGTAVIVAGSPEMTGAQVLCTHAALRSGAGIVRIYAPAESLISSRVNLPSAVISVFPGTVSETVRLERSRMKKSFSYAIGPGIDPLDPRMQAMLQFLIEEAGHLVIDATALRMIASERSYWIPLLEKRAEDGLEPAVLTPHTGELSDLTGVPVSDKEGLIAAASKLPAVVVCKTGAQTYVINGDDEPYSLNAPNSGLGKGGSGDVLTGLITGLSAQGLNATDAAAAGVYLHSEAGAAAASRYGKRFMQPTDVINCLQYVYEGLENGK